jgi:hypothetical protein
MSQPKPSIVRRLRTRPRRAWLTVRPGQHAWTGAALGLLAVALLFVFSAVCAGFAGTDLAGCIPHPWVI